MLSPRTLSPFAWSLAVAAALGQSPVSLEMQACQVSSAVVCWSETRAEVHRVGKPVFVLPNVDALLHLRSGTFDPLAGEPTFPPVLMARPNARLFAVQFHTAIVPEYRTALAALGLQVVGFWPSRAFVVRGSAAAIATARQASYVRWAGPIAAGHKLEPQLTSLFISADVPIDATYECNVVLASKSDRTAVARAIEAEGGVVTKGNDGSVFLSARLSREQLAAIAWRDDVVWIDRSTAIESDMHSARVQGGANTVEFSAGMTGTGIRAQILEGVQQTHRDWTLPVLVHFDSQESHGHCTGMIVGGNGSLNTNARGLLPDGQIIESSVFSWGASSRHQVTAASIDPLLPWRVMQSTASWGHTATLDYNSITAELDDVLFDLDLATTQSQSNTGTQLSRPQAWAKNVISVGGVWHHGTASTADDHWFSSPTPPASIGPASDGRIKPDLCAYYDNVTCGDLMGTEGYSTTDYASSFGGTSAATPIVNGFLGLAQQMFTDGAFGHALPLAATAANRFANKPHMTTAKAMLCTTASSYAFSGAGHDLTRTHQGWGFPAVDRLWQNRQKLLLVDESERLLHGESRTYYVYVAAGTPEFRATLTWSDPPALPNAAIHRVNDLDLQVRYFHDGLSFWGNRGLDVGNQSTSGGTPNDRDTLEQVWLQNPAAGIYTVTVTARSLVQDGHVETPQIDADFALALHPMGGGYRVPTTTSVTLQSSGPGDLRIQPSGVPANGWVEGFTFASTTNTRARGFGNFFGLEYDEFTAASLSIPAMVGDPFHFVNAGASVFPFQAWVVPPPVALSLRGVQFDLMMMLFDAQGRVVEVSNVSRVTVP